MMKRLLMAMMLMVASMAAHADQPRLRFLGSVGYGWGGDKVISGTYSDGTAFELLTGTGWTWTVGGDLRIFDSLYVQATVGQQRNRINASNADFDFFRTPVELMAFVSATEQFRVGLGVHKSFNVRATGTGDGAAWSGTGTYDGSVGGVLEFQYLFWPPSKSERAAVWGVNLRFIKEDFTLSTSDNSSTSTGTVKNADQMAVSLVLYY